MFTKKDEEWLYWAVKKLRNETHTSAQLLPGEDPGLSVVFGGSTASHPILHAGNVIAGTLPRPAPVIAHNSTDGTFIRYGDFGTPPTDALELAAIPDSPQKRAWIAVKGDEASATPMASAAPSVGFLDAWANGSSGELNAAGGSYTSRLWRGVTWPMFEILPSDSTRPVWDGATGILAFTGESPEDAYPEGTKIWYTGYLYVGETLRSRLTSINSSWKTFSGIMPPSVPGVGNVGSPVLIPVAPPISNNTMMLAINGILQFPPADYLVTAGGGVLALTQKRKPVNAGDELQLMYQSL